MKYLNAEYQAIIDAQIELEEMIKAKCEPKEINALTEQIIKAIHEYNGRL